VNLVVTNANVVTMDAAATRARAIAIEHGRIAAVGADSDVRAWRTRGVRVIDARGRTVLPGFIEPHNHMVGYATALLGVDVRTPPNRTIDDIVERLRERARQTPPGQWVLGRGYDDTGVVDQRHPNRRDLDRASTEHPIVIWHNSGHLLAANSAALRLGGVLERQEDPAGGRIGRFAGTGEPDGVLYELPAQLLVTRLLPPYDAGALRRALDDAQAEYLRRGVTTIHDAYVMRARGIDMLAAYRQARRDERLRLRVNMFIGWDLLKEMDFAPAPGSGDEWLRVAGCKIVSDGSIQGITAALREPYACNHDERGWLIYEQAELDEMVRTLHEKGYQIKIHANGDAAIDSVLTAYGRALAKAPKADHRYRVEHCQVCHPEHLSTLRRLGVIPDFFVNHVYYWGDRHRDRFLGPERVKHLDPVGSAIHAGLRPMLHSDCPVTPVGPLFCVKSAVSRLTSSGKVLNDEERISVHEAIAAMTVNAAHGAFEERRKGTLEVGKLGDLVILEQDPFEEAPGDIGAIEVAATVVGGEVMHATKEMGIP
jgi:predicted amidohydrolase YtcJ